MTNDLHQSEKYGQYMKKVGWIVEKIDCCQIFIRRFPLIGSFIKIQKPTPPVPFEKIEKIAKKYRAFKIVIEPRTIQLFEKFDYQISNSPYLPTKTIHINLTKSEKEILSQMKKKTRYCLRRGQESRVTIKESKEIESFIKLKSSQFFPFGFFMRKDISALWQAFYPENAILLFADKNIVPSSHPEFISGSPAMKIPKQVRNDTLRPLAVTLLLFHQKTAHYWLAASTKQGKKLFAPTLLVWEAIKLSKKRGCKIFDFQGIYDPRFHKSAKSWQGFTRFKKGFGGKEIEYPGSFLKSTHLFFHS